MQLPTIDSPRITSISTPIENKPSPVEQRTNNVFKTVFCVLVTVLATTEFVVGLKLPEDSPVKELFVITGIFMAAAGAMGTAIQAKRMCCPRLCQERFM